MKQIILLIYLSFFLSINAQAHVIFDGSMGHKGEAIATNGYITISQDMGQKSGDNLFHSFKSFDINQGETVTFTSENSFKNVISRVTGGAMSHINGRLASEIKGANFYFINPAGIFFGKGASIDMPAAFHISTSDSLHFKDGHTFSTALPLDASSLSIAQPADFGFLTKNSGDINIQGANLNLVNYNDVLLDANNIIIDSGSLAVPAGEIIINTQGDLVLEDSYINNNVESSYGTIPLKAMPPLHVFIPVMPEMFAIAAMPIPEVTTAPALVMPMSTTKIETHNPINIDGKEKIVYPITNFNKDKLDLNNDILINSSLIQLKTSSITSNIGDIDITAEKLTLFDNSFINKEMWGNLAITGGLLKIKADIELNNISEINISNQSSNTSEKIIINGDNVVLDNNSLISSGVLAGKNNAAQIDITATKQLKLDFSSIYNGAGYDSIGDGGKTILNSNTITLEHYAHIYSSTIGYGNAGDIIINTNNTLILNNYSSIESNTNSNGNAGKIIINNNSVSLKDSSIGSSTYGGEGNAGQIDINAKEKLTLNNSYISNGLFNYNSTGKGGTLTINSNKVDLNNSAIDSETYSNGNASNILINSGNLLLDNSNIKSDTLYEKGNAGKIDINITKKLTLKDGGSISSSSFAQGNAGDININANTINIYGQGYNSNNYENINGGILAIANWDTSSDSIHAGNINITATKTINLYDGGTVSIQNGVNAINENYSIITKPESITINAPDINLSNSSVINAQATGTANAGLLNINFAHALTIGKDSELTTQANIGNGGDITINGGQLINLHDGARIDTFTQQGSQGGNIKGNATALLMNEAQIKTKADNANNGGDITLDLKALVSSHNQLDINGRPMANSESGELILNSIQTANSGTLSLNTPQLNLSGNLGELNYTLFESPDLNKDSCQSNPAMPSSVLKRISKGGIAINEKKWIFIPPVLNTAQQLQSVITPNLTSELVSNHTPCTVLSL